MNKKKPKYSVGWPTHMANALVISFSLLLAYGHARQGEYGRMMDNICFIAVVLFYWYECHSRAKAWNVASESIIVNDQLVDINTKLGEAAASSLAAYKAQTRKLNGMKNAVRVAAYALRMARAKVKLLDKECGRLHQKLDAYEDKEVRV